VRRRTFADARLSGLCLTVIPADPRKAKPRQRWGSRGRGFRTLESPRQRLTDGPGTGMRTPRVSFGTLRYPREGSTVQRNRVGSVPGGRAGGLCPKNPVTRWPSPRLVANRFQRGRGPKRSGPSCRQRHVRRRNQENRSEFKSRLATSVTSSKWSETPPAKGGVLR
jgi:hypothetical protein